MKVRKKVSKKTFIIELESDEAFILWHILNAPTIVFKEYAKEINIEYKMFEAYELWEKLDQVYKPEREI